MKIDFQSPHTAGYAVAAFVLNMSFYAEGVRKSLRLHAKTASEVEEFGKHEDLPMDVCNREEGESSWMYSKPNDIVIKLRYKTEILDVWTKCHKALKKFADQGPKLRALFPFLDGIDCRMSDEVSEEGM